MEWDSDAMEHAYKVAKSAKVGDMVKCPTCGKVFKKGSYQQAFCRMRGKGGKDGKGNLCKDQYWNFINPRGMKGMQTLAIRERIEENQEDDWGIHPFSEDAFIGG